MLSLPSAAEPLIMKFSIAFTQPTFKRILLLLVGGILTVGRHTITAVLRTMGPLVPGHFSSYHRLFSRAVWSLWPLGRVLATAILHCLARDERILVVVDDTTAQHRGKDVYGKGCHHDAVRSAHKHVVFRWGHRWVVLAISVKFPFTTRRWALPVLCALYRPQELNLAENHRHKTPPYLARQLVAVLIHWFPQRQFVLLGDGGYASHELARFCRRHRHHVTLVSRFYPQANLYAAVAKSDQKPTGRPREKGGKLPAPQASVTENSLRAANVDWYGGGRRQVRLTSNTGLWYKGGDGLVPIRWVFVRDVTGTHRDEYFYSTNPDLSATRIVSWYTARWSIETTFQEVREHLGFETPRQRVAQSVLRTAPCLLGLFSIICLIFAAHTRQHRIKIRAAQWYTKSEPTFSDAIATVRRLFWNKTIFEKPSYQEGLKKLPPKLRNLLLDHLCRAA